MNALLRCSCAAVLATIVCGWSLSAAPDDDLLAAAARGDGQAVANALAAGADPNARDRAGTTALLHAVAAESFTAARELLWAGAEAAAANRAGQTPISALAEMTDENRPLHILLRCFAYLQANGRRAASRPTRPHMILIMEDTVNYLHPKIKAAYFTNPGEANGAAGRDDDNNGFIDDVYGWTPVKNRPYQIREAQLNTYLRYRTEIGRILQIEADRVAGNITAEVAEEQLAEFTNPLAQMMGPLPGLSDGEFLNMVKNIAHGSHVAGIALEASEGRALLHTLAVDFHEESRRPLGPNTEKIVTELVGSSRDPETFLKEYRARLLAHMTSRAKLSSQYLQTTGAGVVNLSFGGTVDWWQGFAMRLIGRSLSHLLELDPSFEFDFERFEQLAAHWGFELYLANAVEVALLAYENPDVLFVCAAGNDDANNDQLLPNPAYLSRFFPNVITVASVGEDDTISGFTNFGVLSVNVCAPGENILSTVIPEASMYMDGTSMATPHVAGVAALMRSLVPDLTAAELRRQLEYTVRESEVLHRFTSSGGVVDKDTLRALHVGDARKKSDAYARMAINTAQLDGDLYPRHQADADRYSQRAIELDNTNVEAWRSRAAYFDIVGQPKRAVEFIDRAVQLAPDNLMVLVSRALIQEHNNDRAGAIESLNRIIDALAAAGADYDLLRARSEVDPVVWTGGRYDLVTVTE